MIVLILLFLITNILVNITIWENKEQEYKLYNCTTILRNNIYFTYRNTSKSPTLIPILNIAKPKNSYSNLYTNINNFLIQDKKRIKVRYVPRPACGFANRFRSICGLIVLSTLNNASLCVKYDAFFEVMNDSLLFLKCNTSEKLPIWQHEKTINWIKSCHGFCQLKQSYEISTFSDYTHPLLDNSVYNNYFINNYYNGTPFLISKGLYSYLFRPKQYLENYANNILQQMNGVRIGIQLRFGGNTASTHEGFIFLNASKIHIVISQIKEELKKVNVPYTIYLSTDSTYGLKALSTLNLPILTTTLYAIGHSMKPNVEFLKRAVIDLYVLAHCDILLATRKSSFGRMAFILSNLTKITWLQTK